MRPYTLIGLFAQSPPSPAAPQVEMSPEPPHFLFLEKTASTCFMERHFTGLSLFTYTARASIEVGTAVGLYPAVFSKASTSFDFIILDMGPNWEVPSMRAGGAVLEPLPSIWHLTLG